MYQEVTGSTLTHPEVHDAEGIFKYVKGILGFPIVDVEVTDEQLQEFLKNTLETYSRMIPDIKWFSITAYAGVQEYKLNRDTIGYGVVKVMIPRLDPIAPLLLSSGPRLDIFGYRYSYPYRDLSELFTDYMYFSEAQRILSADFDWEYLNGALRIHPKPDEAFPLSYASAFPRGMDAVPMSDLDWVRKHLLAQTKMAVGHARRKYHVPGAQTPQLLDGRDLVNEAIAELQLAEEELLRRTPPFPVLRSL